MEFHIVNDPNADDIMDVRRGLIAFNDPFVEDAQDIDVGVYAVDDAGKRVGGIVSKIWGNWMYIRFLWVDPALSGSGLGTQLMKRMEDYAIAQGCHSAWVDTLSFQAKPFYEKCGYQCQMTLNDYPVAHQLHFLTKKLVINPTP
ncbi:GNAT family N-acetyltransferase [Enterovibrio baiacu]|uniref:GNAT family N-acetyltransferase n=1 Tax=Enterovibrio baiacu TaxID=2491023 RepID=UPI001010D2DD|nr:GNAT family N-acetyltransferase [Enterovibrio baiacu]MBE1275685.1 GNAT family N-acetyltransferase [Enterovibrio baiacu]